MKNNDKKTQDYISSDYEDMQSEEGKDISLQAGLACDQTLRCKQVALETLVCYFVSEIAQFQEYVLLTNLLHDIECFVKLFNVKVSVGSVLKVACRVGPQIVELR